MLQISVGAAFLAGILSFFSPCVFPLIPAYLGFLTGTAQETRVGRGKMLAGALLFVLGFSAVFVGLGALAGFLGFYALRELPWLTLVAGVIVILFGVQIIFATIFPRAIHKLLPLLYMECRLNPARKMSGVFRPLLIGVVFGLGWTPCIGPVLGGILALAYSGQTAAKGAFLLAIYSAGLGIPFILSALAVERLQAVIRRMGRAYLIVEICAGLLLIFTGLLIATDWLLRVVSWLWQYFPSPGIGLT